MNHKKIYIIVGHPNKDSLSSHIADTYEQTALSAGHSVRRVHLGSISFDPILHMGYKQRQNLEPDLVTIQENVVWADTLVFVFPTWWGDMPALLKGMFERMWLPGFAYNMKKGSMSWHRRLTGKRARIITTSQTAPWILKYGFCIRYTHLKWLTLWFSGIYPVRMTRLGNAEKLTPAEVVSFLKKIAKLARKAI